jgi:hypothetical protein
MPMIYPTAERVLDSVVLTLDEVIQPALRRDYEEASADRRIETKRVYSSALTLAHLVRHCRNRVAEEGQIFYDEILMVTPLVADIAAFIRAGGELRLAADLDAAVSEAWPPAGVYPSLALTVERTNRLRLAVQDGLAWLQANEATLVADPGYAALRARIRANVADQMTRENDLVDRSYRGFGLRR